MCFSATIAYWAFIFLGPVVILLWNNLGYYVSGTGWGPNSLMYRALQFLSQPISCALAYAIAKNICKDHSKNCIFVNCIVSALACAVFAYCASTQALLVSMSVSSLICLATALDDAGLFYLLEEHRNSKKP